MSAEITRLAVLVATGAALGAASLGGLRLSTRLYTERSTGRALLLEGLRLSGVVSALVLAAMAGPAPLVALAAGFIAIRAPMTRLLAGWR